MSGKNGFDAFISYAILDSERVGGIVHRLEENGLTVWRDKNQILGGSNYGPEIVRGIKGAKVLLLMCTNASLRSKNVKQEIQLAWKYNVPYLPLLLEPVSFSEQVEYWLEGSQWIEILHHPPSSWLPAVMQGIKALSKQPPSPGKKCDLAPLRQLASLTDQLWPIPAETSRRGLSRSGLRDLGAPQQDAAHTFRLGSSVRLAIEADHPCHLLLLDEGPTGNIYCLCPSQFAKNTALPQGKNILPQADSPHPAFVVSGAPGREHLLAILTREPLDLDWLPTDPGVPARQLSPADIDDLLTMLDGLDGDSWLALSTWFDVIL